MKFVIRKSELSPMLSAVKQTALNGSIQTVLACVRIEAAGQTLILRTHRLEANTTAEKCHVQIEDDGFVHVDISRLIQVVDKIEDEHIYFESSKGVLSVKTDHDDFTFSVNTTESLPETSETEGARFFVKAGRLLSCIRRVSFAAGATQQGYKSEVIAILPGKVGRVAAASSRIVAIDTLGVEVSGTNPAMIAVSSVKEITGILSAFADSETEIIVSDNAITIACEGVRYTTSLTEGSFPPVDAIIPTDPKFKGNVGIDGLVRTIQKASLFTTAESKAIKFDVSNRTITASALGATGSAKSKTTCGIDGDISMNFNPEFLLSPLRTAKSEMIDVEFTEPRRPMVLRDDERICLVASVN